MSKHEVSHRFGLFGVYCAKLLSDTFMCYFCVVHLIEHILNYVVIYLCNHVYILHFIGAKWAGILKRWKFIYRLKFLKWHKTLAFPLLFRMFSHTSKKKCRQFPIELLHKRGLTNKSLCQCPFFSSQRPKAHLHEKNTSSVYRESPPSVFSIHHLSLRTQITATYRAWFIIHNGLFVNSWDCNCNDKVVQ